MQLNSLCFNLNFYFVDWKLILTRCFVTKKIYSEKIKDCNTLHADIGKPQWLCLVCQDGEIIIHGKRKLRQRDIGSIQLYCKHGGLAPPRDSQTGCFLNGPVSLNHFSPTILFSFPPFTCTPAFLPPPKTTKISFFARVYEDICSGKLQNSDHFQLAHFWKIL